MSSTGKRVLSSPEEVQEAVGRRVKHTSVPPIGGILTATRRTPPPPSLYPEATAAASASSMDVSRDISAQAPVPPTPVSYTHALREHSPLDKSGLIDAVHAAVRGIGTVANASNKLNMADKTTIATLGQDILALMAQLMVKLCDGT